MDPMMHSYHAYLSMTARGIDDIPKHYKGLQDGTAEWYCLALMHQEPYRKAPISKKLWDMGYDFRISCVGVWSFRPCSLSGSPKFLQFLHVWKRGCGRVLVCEWRGELGQLSAIDPTPVHKVFCVLVSNNKEERDARHRREIWAGQSCLCVQDSVR